MTPTLPQPDRLVHEPARLAILTVLAGCASADFVFLTRITGLSKGNLSIQLGKLEEAGLVRMARELIENDKKTRTTIELTSHGATALATYWRTMDQIRGANGKGRTERKRKPLL